MSLNFTNSLISIIALSISLFCFKELFEQKSNFETKINQASTLKFTPETEFLKAQASLKENIQALETKISKQSQISNNTDTTITARLYLLQAYFSTQLAQQYILLYNNYDQALNAIKSAQYFLENNSMPQSTSLLLSLEHIKTALEQALVLAHQNLDLDQNLESLRSEISKLDYKTLNHPDLKALTENKTGLDLVSHLKTLVSIRKKSEVQDLISLEEQASLKNYLNLLIERLAFSILIRKNNIPEFNQIRSLVSHYFPPVNLKSVLDILDQIENQLKAQPKIDFDIIFKQFDQALAG
ncbi:MAG: hypothetical protein ACKOAD_08315 [Gammaproteobacteria bacterium]